jgi:hypothetical protein
MRFSLLWLLALLLSPIAQAQVDPIINWKVRETAHFEIIYPDGYQDLARIYAEEAESSFLELRSLFGEITKKTIVVLLDNTDSTNGYANFLPYAHVVIFPVLPPEVSTISNYEDWPRDLFLHEYAHILSFQPSHGIYTPLRWIFGTIIRPNALLPRWFLEGLAVQVESRYTDRGRLKSPEAAGLLRAMVRDETLQSIPLTDINEVSVPKHPYGQRPYLLGALLWQEILLSSSPGVVERLHQRHSRRLPFLMHGPIQDETKNFDYNDLLKRAIRRQEILRGEELKSIRAKISTVSSPLVPQPQTDQLLPRVSPDGQHLVFFEADAKLGPRILWISKPSPVQSHSFLGLKSSVLTTTRGTLQIDWHPSSKSFVFEKIGRFQHYSQFSDLYSFDVQSLKTKQLTFGARAREARHSPDGRSLAFVQLESSRTSLVVLDLDSKTQRKLFTPPLLHRVSSPFWLDSKTIAFVGRNRKGQQGLYKIQIPSGGGVGVRPVRLLPNFDFVSQPQMTKRGLFFTSTLSGVSNLYLSSPPFATATPITNSETHIYQADLDPQTEQVILSEGSGTGPQLKVLTNVKAQSPPQLKTHVVDDLSPLTPPVAQKGRPELSEETDYQGLRYLRPRYWVPAIFPIEGGAIFQGLVQSQDPLQHHLYALGGSFDTVTEKFAYSFGYSNQTTPVTVSLGLAEFQNYLPGADLTLTNRFQNLDLSFYLSRQAQWRGSIGYIRDETESRTRTLKGAGPTVGTHFSSEATGGRGRPQIATSLLHTQFLPQDDHYDHGKSQALFSLSSALFLPTTHNFSFTLKGSHSPQMNFANSILLGDKTVGGNFLVNIINSNYVMRGYPTGAFAGRSLINGALEYQFSVSDIYRGWGTFPLFVKDLSAAVFVDGVAVDGGYLDPDLSSYRLSTFDDTFWSTGFELYWSATAGYHLPISFIFGLYYGFSESAGGGLTPFLSLGYTGHGGVDKK